MGDWWSVAWRLHDAQFWGVPQRRKRIALVADFGGATAPEILFERKGLSGDIKESGEEGKAVAENAGAGIEETVYCLQGNGIDRADTAECNGKGWREDQCYTLNTIDRPAVCVENHPNDSRVKIREDGMFQTLTGRMGTGVGCVPILMEAISFGNGQVHDAMSPSVEVAKTLNCMVDPAKIVTYGLDRAAYNQENIAQPLVARGPQGGTDTVGALCARDYKGVGNQYVDEGKVIVQSNRKLSE